MNARHSMQTFISLAFMFAPIVFIIPYLLIFAFLVIFTAVFLYVSYMFKPYAIFLDDLFSVVAALILSQGTAYFIWSMRLSENEIWQKLEHLSKIDRLTGILNKGTFEDDCRSYLTLRKDTDTCSLLIIDLDNFKAVNDTYGHIIGDELLDEFGHSLLKIFRPADIIGRIGGDEFCVLIKNTYSQELIQKKAVEIQNLLKTILTSTLSFDVTCSIGAAINTDGFISYLDLFRKADIALYKAKLTGKNSCIIYPESNFAQEEKAI